MDTKPNAPDMQEAVATDTPRARMHHHSGQARTKGDTVTPHPLDVLPRSLRRSSWWAAVACLACIGSFLLGFWASDRRLERRAQESGRRQVEEFVLFAERLGVLDRQRLDEAVITASEAEWEDRDAEQCKEGGKQ